MEIFTGFALTAFDRIFISSGERVIRANICDCACDCVEGFEENRQPWQIPSKSPVIVPLLTDILFNVVELSTVVSGVLALFFGGFSSMASLVSPKEFSVLIALLMSSVGGLMVGGGSWVSMVKAAIKDHGNSTVEDGESVLFVFPIDMTFKRMFSLLNMSALTSRHMQGIDMHPRGRRDAGGLALGLEDFVDLFDILNILISSTSCKGLSDITVAEKSSGKTIPSLVLEYAILCA